MNRLDHTDNICTVGWTQFHAYLDYGDATLFEQIEPRVIFIPTFYKERSGATLEGVKGIEEHVINPHNSCGFYIAMPKDSPLFTYLMIQLENKP